MMPQLEEARHLSLGTGRTPAPFSFEALRVALSRSSLAWRMALLGGLLALTAVGPCRVLDDYVLALAARGGSSIAGLPAGQLELFDFTSGERAANHALMDQGVLLPWWASADLKLTFFRPLSSLVHRLDYALWPDSPRLMYVHGILWFSLCLFLVARLYQRLEGNALLAGVATVLYALDHTHGPVVAWLSNRNALIATCFGAACLLAHDRARRERHGSSFVLAPLYLLLGLLAGEFGIGAVGYLVAYALFLEPDGPRSRVRSLLPHALSLSVWGLAYCQSGAGARGSGVYLHPLENAREFLFCLPGRLTSLLGAALGPVPSDLSFLDRAEHAGFWIGLGGLVLLLSAKALWSSLKRDRLARFWLSGMLLSAVPVAASFPSDRLLPFVGIGAMALVARIVAPLLHAKFWSPAARGRRVLVLGFALVHCVVSPLALPFRAAQMQVLGRTLTLASSYLDKVPDLAGRTVVVISTPVDFFSAYIQLERAWQRLPRPEHLYWLANATAALSVTRLGGNTLRVEREGGFLSTPLERHYRDAKALLPLGATIVLSEMTARIASVTDDGRPRAVDFSFERRLESSSYLFLAWKGDRFEPVSFKPTGSTLTFGAEDVGKILTRTAFGAS